MLTTRKFLKLILSALCKIFEAKVSSLKNRKPNLGKPFKESQK